MKYLSFDIESTGLGQNCHTIEFGMLPFCTQKKAIEHSLSFHAFIKCPSFESLKPKLDPWVIDHNQTLIEKAHTQGLPLCEFKQKIQDYIKRPDILKYFGPEKIVLFGKSMNAIDLPFLNRDLGWDFMRQHFSHRTLDLTSVVYALIDLKLLPKDCESGSFLSEHLGFGEVAHTALEDAILTAQIYLKLISQFNLHPQT